MYNFKVENTKIKIFVAFHNALQKTINKCKTIIDTCEYYAKKQQVAKEHKLPQMKGEALTCNHYSSSLDKIIVFPCG